MAQLIELHPVNPQPRMVALIAGMLKEGAVIAYPTDSGYALGCQMGARKPLRRIIRIRELDHAHNFTLICKDLSEIAHYARVDNDVYRVLKKCTPGGYTFILKATHEVPKLMQNPRKKTIGIRVPDFQIPLSISEQLGEPMMSSTLILPTHSEPLTSAEDVIDHLEQHVDVVIDGGYCGFEPTTVIDVTEGVPIVLRQGTGSLALLGIDEHESH